MTALHLPFRFISTGHRLPPRFGEGSLFSTFNRCGIFFCRAGEVEVVVGEERCLIRRGDLYLYIPSTLVRIARRTADAGGFIVEADSEFVLQASAKVADIEPLLAIRRHPCISLTDEEGRRMEQFLRQLRRRILAEEKREGSLQHRRIVAEQLRLVGQLLLYEVLELYFSHQPPPDQSPGKGGTVFRHFMTALYRFHRKRRDVKFYAQLQHIDPRYFTVLIRKESGNYPSGWITQMVISEAKQLLSEPELSIKEISEQLNFSNQSFFGKYFKQHTGLSPKAYRRSILKPV